jgi:serine/threonine protein kinase
LRYWNEGVCFLRLVRAGWLDIQNAKIETERIASMADSTQRLIRDLFNAASELPAAERQAWVEAQVEAQAQGDPEIVSNVMRLLNAASASGQGFMAEPAWKRESPALQEGMMIGPYRVLRELGSGGMGVVYLTMRSDEVYRRLAALKVIRPELRTNPLKHRFLQEREILARLDHPNIARIIDGGTTPSGLPYFVMDYVDGQPLDEFCRNRQATLEQRLNLFRQTCEAVQYLHDNNVLHRDLKPANILVTHTGQIKLLDFGVSKLEGEFSTTMTTGMPVLTAGYASPEQITSKPVTSASDIYSLGVVLYELLTGVRPLQLDGKNLPEILATITEQIPPKPSTQQPLPDEADPGHLLAGMRPRLAGDLDCILLMALRKEPERRYVSAASFAADIERFQQGRAVQARGEGTAYRLGKTLRRHGLRIAAILLIGISVTGGAAASYVALQERHQVQSLENELVVAKSHEPQYRTLPAPQASALLKSDLTHLTTEIQTKTPDILSSKLAPRGMTKEMVQQSLSYFADTQGAAQQNADTMSALGRAYLAVAQTQWSSDHASLNDPSEAARTCLEAVKALTASGQLSNSPEVQQTLGQIKAVLEANPATRSQDLQGSQE